MLLSTARVRLARAIVRRYPRAWRDRYESELLALVQEVPPRWRDLADLSRGCAVERARALYEPAAHPTLTLLLVGAGRYLIVPALVFASFVAIGGGLRVSLGTLSGAAADAAAWTLTAALVGSLIAYLARGLYTWSVGTPRWSLGITGSIVWFGLVGVHAVVSIWADQARGSMPIQLFYFTAYATVLVLNRLRTCQRLIDVVNQLLGAREMIGKNGWARLELARCESLAAQGVPMADGLVRARAEFDRWQAVHDEALRALSAMGYRGRLRRSAEPSDE
jgi:hypothetical protein